MKKHRWVSCGCDQRQMWYLHALNTVCGASSALNTINCIAVLFSLPTWLVSSIPVSDGRHVFNGFWSLWRRTSTWMHVTLGCFQNGPLPHLRLELWPNLPFISSPMHTHESFKASKHVLQTLTKYFCCISMGLWCLRCTEHSQKHSL